jgi:hypothetical protein
VQALYEFMSDKGYRVIDLFKRFDTDRSMSLTKDEFTKGLQVRFYFFSLVFGCIVNPF